MPFTTLPRKRSRSYSYSSRPHTWIWVSTKHTHLKWRHSDTHSQTYSRLTKYMTDWASYHHHCQYTDCQQLLDNLLVQSHCWLLWNHHMLWRLQTEIKTSDSLATYSTIQTCFYVLIWTIKTVCSMYLDFINNTSTL